MRSLDYLKLNTILNKDETVDVIAGKEDFATFDFWWDGETFW